MLEILQSDQAFFLKTIGIKPIEPDLRKVKRLDIPFLYSFSLKIDPGFDGKINQDLEATKTTLFNLLTTSTNDWQSLFEQAYSIGTQIERWGLRTDDLTRTEEACAAIYAQELQFLEQETPEGKKYLPQDTTSRLILKSTDPLNRAQSIYAAGFSAGVLFRDGDKRNIPVETNSDFFVSNESLKFIDFPSYKKMLSDMIRLNADDFVNKIFMLSCPFPNTISELENAEQIISQTTTALLPGFEQRIFDMIGKKKGRTLKVDGNFTSEWNLEYTTLISQAKLILQKNLGTEYSASPDPKEVIAVANRLRRLFLKNEVLVRDAVSGKLQEKQSINDAINGFLIDTIDTIDIINLSLDDLYDAFLLYFSKKSRPNINLGLAKPTIPKGMENASFSSEEQMRILDAISPFDSPYYNDLNEKSRNEIFYRWLKALSILADINKPNAGNKLMNRIMQSKISDAASITNLINNVSSFIEFGLPFEELTNEQQSVVKRMELLDEINHYIRVVTGLKFESLIQKPEDLKLRNVSRQFVRMIYVLINKKIARGEISQDQLYPVKPKPTYAGKNTRTSEGIIYDEQLDKYPYLLFVLEIPNLNAEAKKRASILLMNLMSKYPLEIAVPTFLYTIYDAYGDIEINGVINQIYSDKTGERELKSYYIGNKGSVMANEKYITRLATSIQINRLGSSPKTTITASIDKSDQNTSSINGEMETVNQVEWDIDSLQERVKPVIEELKLKLGSVQPLVFDCEFFHIHADETTPTNVQKVSGLVAKTLNDQLQITGSVDKVVGRPVIDNAHVIDRLDYAVVLNQAKQYGIDIPEVVFEGSPLQQWIGDRLFQLIPKSKIIRRGNSLYYQVNQYVEVELYNNVGTDNVNQACVLNHIANDIYKINPVLWNDLFKRKLQILFPEVTQQWKESGLTSFEQFYNQTVSRENDPENREKLKSIVFNPIPVALFDYLKSFGVNSPDRLEAESNLSAIISSNLQKQKVIPIQILENFFGEQGEKYTALFQELKRNFPLFEKIDIFRIVYDLNTGFVTLVNLANN